MKKAIIMGASSGIGHEVARLLINEGWTVGVAARRIENLTDLQNSAPERVFTAQIDVTEEHADASLSALITQMDGTKGLGPAPAYSATKALQNTYLQALEQLSLTKHHNIRFTDIRPGFVDTPLLSGTAHFPMLMTTEHVAKGIIKAIRQRRHVCVIDTRWRILTFLWRHIPDWIWRHIRLA